MTDTNPSTTRRTALTLIGSSAAGAVTYSGRSVATRSTTIDGEAHFGEVNIFLEVSDTPDGWVYGGGQLDSPTQYTVADNILTPLDPMPDKTETELRNGNATIRSRGYDQGRTKIYNELISAAVTSLTPNGQPKSYVTLDTHVDIETVVATTTGQDRIRLRGPNIHENIKAGVQTSFALPSQTIETTVQRTLNELVDRPEIPKQERARKTETKNLEVELTPKVRVNNLGTVGISK